MPDVPLVLRDDGLDENDRDIFADLGPLRLPYVDDVAAGEPEPLDAPAEETG